MAGGLTHCKKIAALAEARHVGVVPHNPLSPVSTAACVQLDACIPNFAIQEYPHSMSQEAPRGNQLVKKPLKVEKGCLVVPDEPGIGVELDDSALDRFPMIPRNLATRLRYDGAVIDQ
jgi:galactonate dehydratase